MSPPPLLPAFPPSPLLSDSDLLPLLAANPGLRYLNLSCAGTAVTDAALLGAARSCPRLEALDVCHADGMTEEGERSWGQGRKALGQWLPSRCCLHSMRE